jgi:transposase InsO family protein
MGARYYDRVNGVRLNAPMERFFGSLKSEWIPETGYCSFEEAESDVLRYLTHYYRVRPNAIKSEPEYDS